MYTKSLPEHFTSEILNVNILWMDFHCILSSSLSLSLLQLNAGLSIRLHCCSRITVIITQFSLLSFFFIFVFIIPSNLSSLFFRRIASTFGVICFIQMWSETNICQAKWARINSASRATSNEQKNVNQKSRLPSQKQQKLKERKKCGATTHFNSDKKMLANNQQQQQQQWSSNKWQRAKYEKETEWFTVFLLMFFLFFFCSLQPN